MTPSLPRLARRLAFSTALVTASLPLGAQTPTVATTQQQSAGAIDDRRLADHPRVAQALELVRVWLDAQRAYDQIPGISAGVGYDQQLVWAGGFGHADPARRVGADQRTIHSICSISRSEEHTP